MLADELVEVVELMTAEKVTATDHPRGRKGKKEKKIFLSFFFLPCWNKLWAHLVSLKSSDGEFELQRSLKMWARLVV